MKSLLGLFDIIFAVTLFLILTSSYYLGVKHGMKLAKGEVPNVNPVTNLKEYVIKKELKAISAVEKQKADDVQEGWYGENGIMNYDPYYIGKEGE